MQKRGLLIMVLLIVPMLLASFAFAQLCSDTDGGANYAVKGTVTSKTPSFIFFSKTVSYTDSCSWVRDKGTMLTEYSCKGDNVLRQTIACPNCKDGVCPPTATTNITCTDSDGGFNVNSAGTLKLIGIDGNLYNYTDYCTQDGMITEFSCNEAIVVDTNCPRGCGIAKLYKCPNGCSNGACLSAPTNQTVYCKETDNGINYNLKGTACLDTFCLTDYCREEVGVKISEGTPVTASVEGKVYTIEIKAISSDYVVLKLNNETTGQLKEESTVKLSDGVYLTVTNLLYSFKETVPSRVIILLSPTNSKRLVEYYVENNDASDYVCSPYTDIFAKDINCTGGCRDGACIIPPAPSPSNATCKDSDGGLNYYVKGTCISPGEDASDICLPDSQNPSVIRLNEKSCSADGKNCINNIYICPQGYSCTNGACVQVTNQTLTCKETDNGINYNLKGDACIGNSSYSTCKTDYCSSSSDLTEYYIEIGTCSSYTDIFSISYTCPNGCSDGTCIIPPAPSPSNATCKDSDGGKEIYTKGTTTGYAADYKTLLTYSDECFSANIVKEYFCSYLDPMYKNYPNYILNSDFNCPNGCSNGACLSAPTPAQTCTDSDNGKSYLVKGSTTVVKADGTTETNTDFCNKDGTIKEWYCQGSVALGENVKCPSLYYCSNGLCRRLYIGGLAGRVIDGIKGLFVNFGK